MLVKGEYLSHIQDIVVDLFAYLGTESQEIAP